MFGVINLLIQDRWIYELKTVTFGVNFAPYLAIRTLHQLASDCESSYFVGCTIRNRDELTYVLKSAGFSLRKWTANERSPTKDIPPEHLLDSNFLKFWDADTAKVLGFPS